MKTLLLPLVALVAFATAHRTFAQDDAQTVMASSGKIIALATNQPQWITAEIKTAGGTTQQTFTVSGSCKFITSGFGAYEELKRGDNVKLEYVAAEGGTNELKEVFVQSAPSAAKTTTPAKTPAKAPAKAPAKKPAAKKPVPKKK